MKNISSLTGVNFKVHNTWKFFDTWENGGNELFIKKILSTTKKIIKEQYDLGRVSKMYAEQGQREGVNTTYFFFETKKEKVSVILKKGWNMNGGTWMVIEEIKFV